MSLFYMPSDSLFPLIVTQLDYIPVASTIFSGPVRIISGALEVALSIFRIAISTLFVCIGGNINYWHSEFISSAGELVDGAKNIFRGIVALIPVLGNASLKFYDSTNMRLFLWLLISK